MPSLNLAGLGTDTDRVGVLISTTTVVVQPTVTSSLSTSTITATVSIAPIPSTTLTTSISTPTVTSVPSTLLNAAPLTCSSGFQSCPESLGGGCCPTDRRCGPQECPPSSTSIVTSTGINVPVRPTSGATATVTATSDFASATVSSCPTGFYQCNAYYNGGNCCQVGRDCARTSCPPRLSSTLLISNGITVVVGPTGDGVLATVAGGNAGQQRGICATGWFLCESSEGVDAAPQGMGVWLIAA